VLAGFDTRHDTPPFKSRHHPNSRIARTRAASRRHLGGSKRHDVPNNRCQIVAKFAKSVGKVPQFTPG
ncbi:hypothetical protein, partial [Pseudogemmobacter sp. W21_MBD1_M6]|uniref:hypothetical protein n=1 Tax=Pseudogemmobacter sp. W21_MBD1_M6 TaxID=3240271 RepID=UPI003F9C35B4